MCLIWFGGCGEPGPILDCSGCDGNGELWTKLRWGAGGELLMLPPKSLTTGSASLFSYKLSLDCLKIPELSLVSIFGSRCLDIGSRIIVGAICWFGLSPLLDIRSTESGSKTRLPLFSSTILLVLAVLSWRETSLVASDFRSVNWLFRFSMASCLDSPTRLFCRTCFSTTTGLDSIWGCNRT